MPPRVPEEVKAQIIALLKQGLTATEVMAALRGEDIAVSITPITREAYKLGIKLKSGPRSGMASAAGIGRPPLHGRPGTPHSKNRKKVLELYAEGKSVAEIAEETGLTRAGIYRLLADERNRKAQD